jgi:hypothetical protein
VSGVSITAVVSNKTSNTDREVAITFQKPQRFMPIISYPYPCIVNEGKRYLNAYTILNRKCMYGYVHLGGEAVFNRKEYIYVLCKIPIPDAIYSH